MFKPITIVDTNGRAFMIPSRNIISIEFVPAKILGSKVYKEDQYIISVQRPDGTLWTIEVNHETFLSISTRIGTGEYTDSHQIMFQHVKEKHIE